MNPKDTQSGEIKTRPLTIDEFEKMRFGDTLDCLHSRDGLCEKFELTRDDLSHVRLEVDRLGCLTIFNGYITGYTHRIVARTFFFGAPAEVSFSMSDCVIIES